MVGVAGGHFAQAFLAVGREASAVAVRDSMMVCRRVTGWLTPCRYKERKARAMTLRRAIRVGLWIRGYFFLVPVTPRM